MPTDWATHMIGHELTGLYGLDHAQTLAIVQTAVWKHKLAAKQAKLAQYADGASFCRHVMRRGGTGLLNRAFEGPQWLPTLTELLDPEQWCRRLTSPAEDADGQA